MDPGTVFSVLQITVSVARASWWVYALLKDAKNIDQTATAFVNEVETLAVACDAVHDLIKARGQQPTDGLERLWRCLQSRLQACQTTVSELEVAVEFVVNGNKQKRNLFSPIVRQIYLNGKGKDIETARNLIRSHTTSLQIVLQVVGVNVSYLATGAVDSQLPSKLKRLRGTTQELERIRGQRDSASTPNGDDDEQELIRVGNEVASSGETLYARSNAGSSYGHDARQHSVVAYASVYGDPNPEKLSSTGRWIGDQSALGISSAPSSPETNVSSVFTPRMGRQLSSTDNSLIMDQPRAVDNIHAAFDDDVYSDSEDESEIETVQAAIRSGRTLFEARKYKEASARLQVAVRMIQKLPNRREGIYNLSELRHMLAICSFHVQPPAEAFDSLLNFVTSNVEATQQSTENTMKTLEATHLLAITCVRLGRLTHARSYCKAARKARRKFVAKDPLPYFESVALMAKIEELEGNQEEAEVLNSMIPEEHRKNMDESIKDLSVLANRRDSISTGISVPQTNGESAFSGGDPLQDINSILGKTLDLKLVSSNETAGPPPPPPAVAAPINTASSVNVPFQPETQSSYSHYHNSELKAVALSMGYIPPPPADLNARRTWRMFLNVIPKKDDRLTEALLENRKSEALRMLQTQHQTRQRMWPGGGSSPISRKDLHLAALFGDIEIVDRLLICGANVKHKWVDGLTALHCAVMGGYREIAFKLLAAGCPSDAVSERFGTALSLAALGEKIDVLDVLLAKTNAALVENSYLGSAVHAATLTDNVRLIQALSTGRGILELPRQFYPAQVRKLHHLLKTMNLLDPTDEALLAPHTLVRLERIEAPPLAIAAYMGCESAVEYFLNQTSAETNATCKAETIIYNGMRSGSTQHTALTLASMSGNDRIVQLLLARNAVTKSANYEHADPLFLAILNGHESTALVLLQNNAPVRPSALEAASKKSMSRLVDQMRSRKGENFSTISVNTMEAPLSVRSMSTTQRQSTTYKKWD